jgi:hypothetical protein
MSRITDSVAYPMIDRIKVATLFALYQTSIAFGIVLLPVAMMFNKLGVTLPIHRVVDALEAALDEGSTGTA